MDMHDVHDIQFLDLSDVDAHERARVLDSLQVNIPKYEFPWFIGIGKSSEKGKKQTNAQKYDNTIDTNKCVATIDQPPTELTMNSQSTIQYPPPLSSHPMPNTNFVNIGTSPIFNHNPHVQSPVFAGNFQHVHNPNMPQPIRTIPGTPFFFATTASVVNPMYQIQHMIVAGNTTYQSVNQSYGHIPPPFSNGIDHTGQIKVNVPSPPVPFTNVKPYEIPQAMNEQKNHVDVNQQSWQQYQSDNFTGEGNPNSQTNQNIIEQNVQQETYSEDYQKEPLMQTENYPSPPNVENHETFQIQNNSYEPPIPDSHVQSETIKNDGVLQSSRESKPWGGVKSWASLFNTSSNGGSQTINEVPEVDVDQAVNKINEKQVCPIKNPKRAQFVDPECYRMGEFLMDYTLDGRAESLQPRGLINQSNYCYINSILQALIACPPVYNLLIKLSQNVTSNEKRKPTPVIDGVCKFVKEFKKLPANMRVRRSESKSQSKKEQEVIINTDIPFEPSWIYKMLNGIRTDLIEGRQEDAEEFLGLLLNNLNDEMLELIKLVKNEESTDKTANNNEESEGEDKEWQVMGPKNKGSVTRRTEFEKTPISEIFGGFLKSRIHRTGDHVTENIQPFFTLQLNIERVKTVKEALENLTTRYQLEGVTSSKTNEEVEAWQQVLLDELPVILVLHLKCFDFKLDGCTKIVKALEFPIDLKIDTKLLSSKTATPKERQQYKLLAVVYHDGKEASKGHYLTDAFHVGYGGWLRYDDAAVRAVREEEVLRPQGARVPYLLFYRRCDTIRGK